MRSPKLPKPSQMASQSPEPQKDLSMLSDKSWLAAGQDAKKHRLEEAQMKAAPKTSQTQ